MPREHGGELAEWLNEADTAARAEPAAVWVDDRLRLPHPDGAATWAEDGQRVSFLLEYDGGTEHLPVLAAKLDGYAVLAGGLAWHGEPCPVLLFCFGSPRREQAARRALAATSEAARLRIATAALDPRLTSPAGPVWLPLHGTDGGQVRLIDLEQALPDPWQDYRERRARERRQAADREQPSATPAQTTMSPALPGRRSGSGRHLAGRGNPLDPRYPTEHGEEVKAPRARQPQPPEPSPGYDAAPRDDDMDQRVKEVAATLPPLTDRQRDSLARLLRTPRTRAA